MIRAQPQLAGIIASAAVVTLLRSKPLPSTLMRPPGRCAATVALGPPEEFLLAEGAAAEALAVLPPAWLVFGTRGPSS